MTRSNDSTNGSSPAPYRRRQAARVDARSDHQHDQDDIGRGVPAHGDQLLQRRPVHSPEVVYVSPAFGGLMSHRGDASHAGGLRVMCCSGRSDFCVRSRGVGGKKGTSSTTGFVLATKPRSGLEQPEGRTSAYQTALLSRHWRRAVADINTYTSVSHLCGGQNGLTRHSCP